MATTFTFTPSYAAQAARKPKTNNSVFGDGYEQRSEAGLNSQPENWNMQFLNRPLAEGDSIDAFLSACKGVNYFLWTTPRGVAGKFICREWSYNLDVGNNVTIAGLFEQVFDP